MKATSCRALKAGARAYILKNSAEADLIRAVRTVADGKSFFSPVISKMLLEDYVRQIRDKHVEDSYDLLTPREREILQLVAEGRTNKEVANLLHLSVYTVDAHRGNILQKLNLHGVPELILYAVRKGNHSVAVATGIGRVTPQQYRVPLPGADWTSNWPSELSDPLFHPQHAQAARPVGVKPASVVFDAQKQRAVVLAHRDYGALRPGMTGHVLQRLLHDTVNARAHFVRERIRHIFGGNRNLDAAAAGDFARLPFQRRDQAQIVQHGRAQQKGDIPNGVHARIGETSNVVQVSKTDGVIRLDPFGQIGGIHQHAFRVCPT